jgi:hypothetical protein
VLSDVSSRTLRVPAGALVAGQQYEFRLCASSARGTGCASTLVQVNNPPASGVCFASRDLADLVVVRCEGWQDEPQQGPLQFAFYSLAGQPLSAGFSTSNTLSVLLSDQALLVSVADALGSATPLFAVPVGGSPPAATAPTSSALVLSKLGLAEEALFVCDSYSGVLALQGGSPAARLTCLARLASSSAISLELSLVLQEIRRDLLALPGSQEALFQALTVIRAAMKSSSQPQLIRGALQDVREAWTLLLPLSSVSLTSLSAEMSLTHADASLVPAPPALSCEGAESLLVRAAAWNLSASSENEPCSDVALLLLPNGTDVSRFGLRISGLRCNTTLTRCSSLSFATLAWSPCVLENASSCLCSSAADAVALFANASVVFSSNSTSAPSGYDLGAVGIAGLIALGCVAAVGALLLALAALGLRQGAIIAGAGKVVFAPRDDGYNAKDGGDTDQVGLARQLVSFGGAEQPVLLDFEDL